MPELDPTATVPERELTPGELAFETIAEVFDDPDGTRFCSPIDGDRITLLTRGGGWSVSGPWHTLTRSCSAAGEDPGGYWVVEGPDEWGHYECCGRTERHGSYPDFDTAFAAARAGAATRHWMDT